MKNTEFTTESSQTKLKANFQIGNAILSIAGIAILAATIFTMWTPANLFSNKMQNIYEIWQAQNVIDYTTPTVMPAARIGIVAGHYGHDSGAVCQDGYTEMEANLKIATLVQQKLISLGYTVDLLEEFDPRLQQYLGLALISIHNDSCDYINDQATGFKVASASNSTYPDRAERLEKCLIDRYQSTTNMHFHVNTITPDMTSYHTFSEINPETTAAIIETGFLNLDQDIIRNKTDQVAEGIVAGIQCFINKENTSDISIDEGS
jgi:N-acetylmuramoyl-L-alanine amidase